MVPAAETLNIVVANMNEVILRIRGRHSRKLLSPKACTRYLDYLRHANELRERCEAEGESAEFLAKLAQPIAFHDQIVGARNETDRFKRSWAGVGTSFPIKITERSKPAIEPQRAAA